MPHSLVLSVFAVCTSAKSQVLGSKAPSDRDLFEILKFTADTGNAWFRGLNAHGIWIPASEVAKLARLGWGLTETHLR